jgi:hypothetical protein
VKVSNITDLFSLTSLSRAPLEESRKWGIYNIINLLFKTYFKLNSISLSKNILKAIQAYQGDMPSLDAFPKAHQVTFKYYVGVIYFLEENYVEVGDHELSNHCQDTDRPRLVREKPHRGLAIMSRGCCSQ